MIRAVIYARYSSNNQRDASIEDQVRECTKELAQLNARCVNSPLTKSSLDEVGMV